jgi:Mor family transcriptional regulator
MFSRHQGSHKVNLRGDAGVSKIVTGIAGVAFMLTLGIGLKPVVAHAAKVDCSKVMSELNSGKKVHAVAEDLKISTSSVYRCRRRAQTAKSTSAEVKSPPMAAPSASH